MVYVDKEKEEEEEEMKEGEGGKSRSSNQWLLCRHSECTWHALPHCSCECVYDLLRANKERINKRRRKNTVVPFQHFVGGGALKLATVQSVTEEKEEGKCRRATKSTSILPAVFGI